MNPLLLATLLAVPASMATAQTFKTLHNFTGGEGASPEGGLTKSANTLYGTTPRGGGSAGGGTVFRLTTDATDFMVLHHFTGSNDGAYPNGELILSGNTLYGTTQLGGQWNRGTVFKVNANGAGFATLHSFTELSGAATNNDGAYPCVGLVLSGNTLYGTARDGGTAGQGTVFALNTNGTDFTTLHSFAAWSEDASGVYTNSDGSRPNARLLLSGDTLYGTGRLGGNSGNGTVFKVHTDGTGFTPLYSFGAGDYDASNSYTNRDGTSPMGGLILLGHSLYGTAAFGGSSGSGTVFALNTNGTGFKTSHHFTAIRDDSLDHYTNSDGAFPEAGLVANLSGNTLYGTVLRGGGGGNGTLFAVNTNGTGFTTLHTFTATFVYPPYDNSDGALSYAGLLLSGDTLYGTPAQGGRWGKGIVFSLSFPPQLTITASEAKVILTWPTNVAGFDYTGYALQSTTNLLSAAAWLTTSPASVVIGSRNTVTNSMSGAQKFYRLIE
jgi:uncharacterized repeat protein (TIGR03803 family)